MSLAELKSSGAFGFPQDQGKILRDDDKLRFSIATTSDHFVAQAILWTDNNPANEDVMQGRPFGDTSSIAFSSSARQKLPNVDRRYYLNPRSDLPGFYYGVAVKVNAESPLKSDSRGSGRIDYVATKEGSTVRIDSFSIPLAELSKKYGETIYLCYFANSPKPFLVLNSLGFATEPIYSDRNVPTAMYHKIKLDGKASISVNWLKQK